MNDVIKPEYLKLCIRYRLLSLLCSTGAYLIWLTVEKSEWYSGAAVSVGMVTAGVIGTFLYRKTFFEEKNRILLLLTLILELGAYGIFICLSGGLSSPYLWYFTGCLFLMAAAGRYRFLLALSTAWCIFCIAAGDRILNPFRQICRSDINTVIGILIVSGGFCTLWQYVVRLDQCRGESELLNRRLLEEKEATEQALHQITDLYDTVNIFTITNQKQSMEELARLLTRSIAPKGCVLVKFNMGEQQKTSEISSCGLEKHTVQEIIKKLREAKPDSFSGTLTAGRQLFSIRTIGEGIFLSGLLIIASGREGEGQAAPGSQTLPFYQNVIETVFKDMDLQKTLEEGIIREEQQRIASEIHDTVIQKLFGISCSLKVLEHGVGAMSGEEIANRLQSVERSARLAMQELREAIYGIRFECDRGGLFEDKLRLYLQEAERLSAVSISLDSTGDFSLLSAAQKTVVYRIVCEAVNNAVRHGKAGHIGIEVNMSKNGIALQIRDDGSGFEPVLTSGSGTGLKNMHRMAALMKGTCSVRSGEGKGTEVDVLLPR